MCLYLRQYRQVRNRVRKGTSMAVKRKEQEIIHNAKSNPKVFGKYVQSKSRSKGIIAGLYNDIRQLPVSTDNKEK